MVAASEIISRPRSRRRFLRTGLRGFRAGVNDQRSMINNQKNGIPFNLLIVPWPLAIERSAALPHPSNSQLLTSNSWLSNMLAGGKKQYYLDQEIALYLLGSGNNGRYYDASAGRFVSEDPTGDAGGDENLFRYTGNDPVNNLDPSGHKHHNHHVYHPPQTQQEQQHNSLQMTEELIQRGALTVDEQNSPQGAPSSSQGVPESLISTERMVSRLASPSLREGTSGERFGPVGLLPDLVHHAAQHFDAPGLIHRLLNRANATIAGTGTSTGVWRSAAEISGLSGGGDHAMFPGVWRPGSEVVGNPVRERSMLNLPFAAMRAVGATLPSSAAALPFGPAGVGSFNVMHDILRHMGLHHAAQHFDAPGLIHRLLNRANATIAGTGTSTGVWRSAAEISGLSGGGDHAMFPGVWRPGSEVVGNPVGGRSMLNLPGLLYHHVTVGGASRPSHEMPGVPSAAAFHAEASPMSLPLITPSSGGASIESVASDAVAVMPHTQAGQEPNANVHSITPAPGHGQTPSDARKGAEQNIIRQTDAAREGVLKDEAPKPGQWLAGPASKDQHGADLFGNSALLAKVAAALHREDPHPLAVGGGQPFAGGSAGLWWKSFASNAYWQSGTPLLNAGTSAVHSVAHPMETYHSAVKSTAAVMAQNLENHGSTLGTLGVGLSYDVNSSLGTGQVLQGVYGVNIVTDQNLTGMQRAQDIIGGAGQIGLGIAGAAKGLDLEGKPPLPRAAADVRGVRRFNPKVAAHANAARAEADLAKTVHSLPNEQVMHWGEPIGSHGADILSVNRKTGEVSLWDSKFRSKSTRIQESPTFTNPRARAYAIRQAESIIENDKSLPPAIRNKALANLKQDVIRTRTVGFGKAKNSVIGK